MECQFIFSQAIPIIMEAFINYIHILEYFENLGGNALLKLILFFYEIKKLEESFLIKKC